MVRSDRLPWSYDLLGDLLQGKSAGTGDDSLLINVEARERSGLTSGGNDNVLSAQSLFTTIQQVHLDGVLVDKSTGTLDVVDAVLLEQKLNTFCETFHGGVLGLHHLLEVQLDITDLNTALFCVVEDLVVEVGVIKQGFRGNAADIQASTTETSTLFNTSGLRKIDEC